MITDSTGKIAVESKKIEVEYRAGPDGAEVIVRIPVDAELAAEAADHVVAQTQFFEIASQHLLNLSVELVGRDIERLESLLEGRDSVRH